jgi:hypothetical protein
MEEPAPKMNSCPKCHLVNVGRVAAGLAPIAPVVVRREGDRALWCIPHSEAFYPLPMLRVMLAR